MLSKYTKSLNFIKNTCLIDFDLLDERQKSLPINKTQIEAYKNLEELNHKYTKIKEILENNICHVMPETMDGYPSGNVYVGMTHEDYEELGELIGAEING